MSYGTVLAERVAGVLTLVRNEARKSLAEERAAFIDQVMLAGEQLDFPLIVTEAFDLAPTVFCWSEFCGSASIEQLRQTHDAAHLKLQGQERSFEIGRAKGATHLFAHGRSEHVLEWCAMKALLCLL